LWLGATSLAGRSILLHAEQGLGDAIQFARYVPMVARAGARVFLEARRPLKALLSGMDGVERFIARGEPLPESDYHCPLMSLPMAFRTGLATVPAAVPYLAASPAQLAKWGRRLGPPQFPRVAIAWAGSGRHKNDRIRSIALPRLAPLLARQDVEIVSIQKDLREGDGAVLGQYPRVIQIGSEFQDFADVAAVACLANVVVSVDSAPAHLAGALGKPVWSCCRSRPTGAGCGSVPTVPGIRRRGCSASRGWATGRRWSPPSAPSLPAAFRSGARERVRTCPGRIAQWRY